MQDLTTTTLQDGRSINAQRSLGDMTYPHCSIEQFNVTSSAISTELVIYCRSLRSIDPSLVSSHPISSHLIIINNMSTGANAGQSMSPFCYQI